MTMLRNPPGARPAAGGNAADIARHSLTAILIAAMFMQFLIEPTLENVFAATIAAAVGVLVVQYAIRREGFLHHPISSLMLFILSCVTGTTALVAQSIGWRAMTFNLNMPVQTFSLGAAFVVLALVAHLVYRRAAPLQRARLSLTHGLYSRLGLMATPTEAQFWIMGAIGLAAVWFVGTANSHVEYGDSGGKFLRAIFHFAYAPFLIPFLPYLFGRSLRPSALSRFLVPAYFALLVVVALARNSRGMFGAAIVLVLMCLMMALFTGRLKLRPRVVVSGLIALTLSVPLMSTLADVSTAMLVSRSGRADVSSEHLIAETIDAFNNKPLLNAYRDVASKVTGSYNEVYISNDFLNRFSVTKYIDLNLYHTRNISPYQVDAARNLMMDRIIAMVPTPLLRAVGVDLDKSSLMLSAGDLYRSYSVGASLGDGAGLGNLTTGSSLVDGTVIFGALFYPMFFVFVIFAYLIYDAFATIGGRSQVVVSPAVLMSIFSIMFFTFSSAEVAISTIGVTRGYVEMIFLYLFMYYATLWVSGLLGVLGLNSGSATAGSRVSLGRAG